MISMSTSGDVPEDPDAQISTSVSEVSDGERLIHLTVARLMADDLLPKARKLGCLSSREKFKKMRQDIESVLAEVQNEELDHGSAVVPKVTVAQIRNLLMEELKGYLHENTEHDRFGDIVRTSSGTIMQRRCEQLDTLTLSLLEAYMSSDDEIQSIKHLFAIVQVDVEAWLVSVIPLSSLLCQRSARSLLADIQEIMEHSDCKLDFFVCLRHLCRSISVDRNEAHETRGIAVPHAWLDELLQWVLNPSNECQLRPIDTFSYVIERGDGDWEVRQEDVDVVPEALFDFFSLCFGSDIRHPCYGSFSRKDQLILANPEAICRVEVSFVLPDGTRIETPCRETTVKAPLTEVIRCAFFSQSDRHDSLLSLECAICAYASLGTSEILEVRMCHNSGCVEPSDSSICSSGEVALRDLVTTPVGKFESTGDHRAIHVLGLEVHFVPSKDEQNPTTHFDLVENRGLCGLYNLGNTCYMNSALQCLSHLDAFRDGLMSLPVSEIPRAHVTTELIALLCGMWSGVNKVARAQNLKLAVSKKSNRFSGYDQEDASEFLEILLDCIHDELNLVTTRKYRQREDSDSTIAAQVLSDIYWADFLENNRSFIPPLLFQQTKTTLTCAQCSHCSVVYDSNLTLSVNIVEPPTLTMVNVHLSVDALSSCGQGSGLVSQVAPISQYVTVELSVRVAQQQDGNLYRVDVEDALNYKLRTSLTLFDSIKEVAGDDCVMEDCRDAWVCSLLCPDVLARDCGTLYAMARQRRPADNEALAKKSVQAVEVWFFAQTPGGHSLVTVEEVLIDLRSDTKSEKSVESSWCDIVVKRAQEVAEAVQKSNNVIPLYGNDVLQPEDLSPIVVTGFADPPSTIHDAPHSLSGIECGLNLGSLMSYDNITEDVIQDWVRLSAEIDAGPVRQFCVVVGDGGFGWRTQSEQFRLRHWSDRQQLWGCGSDDEKGCTLAECVESTFVREVLAGSDEWYCPECKTHREATMERSLFRLPPCLFITLKRFKSQLFRTTKINRVVSLPQRCDFSQFLDATVRERTPAMYYRLQSVVYHSGSLSFGHYTARARRGGADGQWAHFNDAFVTHEPDDTFLDDGAFVLMYQLDNADIEE